MSGYFPFLTYNRYRFAFSKKRRMKVIKTIVGQGEWVHFFRTDGTFERIDITQNEWTALYDWLIEVISRKGVKVATWTCSPLFTSSGGFIANKLLTP